MVADVREDSTNPVPELDFLGLESALSSLEKSFQLSREDPELIPPLELAYIGDCVYDLLVRMYVIENFRGSINLLNKKKNRLVCAHAQSEIMGYLIAQSFLTDSEMDLYRRARNQKTETHSKNSTILEYHRATGFEALTGYFYLSKNYERCAEFLRLGLSHLLTLSEEEDNAG